MYLESKCAFNDSLPLRRRISFNSLSFFYLSLTLSSFRCRSSIVVKQFDKARHKEKIKEERETLHRVFLPVISEWLDWNRNQRKRTNKTRTLCGRQAVCVDCMPYLLLSILSSLFSLSSSISARQLQLCFSPLLAPLFFCHI